MTALWELQPRQQPPPGERLVVWQRGGRVLRYVFGGPLLGFGVLMLWWAVSEPVHRFAEGGFSAVLGWLPSTFFTLLFAALLAPLGWWILFFRRQVVVERGSVQEVKDWRLGRKVTAYEVQNFRKVRVARESISTSSDRSRETKATYAKVVRLLARGNKVPSVEIGLFSDRETERPEELGRLVAKILDLPVEINFDGLTSAPGREQEEEEA